MQLTRPLDSVFDQATKVKLLRVMFSTRAEMPVRKIALAAQVSHVQAGSALASLQNLGAVVSHRAGQALLYSLVLENVLVARMLAPLFESEQRLRQDLLKDIAHELRGVAKAVFIYGSVAMGAEGPASDLDLLVIPSARGGRGTEDKLQRLASNIREGYGCELAPLVLSLSEIMKRYKTKDPLIVAIVGQSVPVIGASLSDVIANG